MRFTAQNYPFCVRLHFNVLGREQSRTAQRGGAKAASEPVAVLAPTTESHPRRVFAASAEPHAPTPALSSLADAHPPHATECRADCWRAQRHQRTVSVSRQDNAPPKAVRNDSPAPVGACATPPRSFIASGPPALSQAEGTRSPPQTCDHVQSRRRITDSDFLRALGALGSASRAKRTTAMRYG
jgi:hypothetical protein